VSDLWPTLLNLPKESRHYMSICFNIYDLCTRPHAVYLCSPYIVTVSSRELHNFQWFSIRAVVCDAPVELLRTTSINFSHRFLNVKAKVRFRTIPLEICGGQTDKGTVYFLPIFQVSPVSIIQPILYILISLVSNIPLILYILFSLVSIIPTIIYILFSSVY